MKFNNIFSLPCLYFPKFVALSSVLFSRLSGSGSVLGIFFSLGGIMGIPLIEFESIFFEIIIIGR